MRTVVRFTQEDTADWGDFDEIRRKMDEALNHPDNQWDGMLCHGYEEIREENGELIITFSSEGDENYFMNEVCQ